MISFPPSGDLLTDLQMCITNVTAVRVSYTDREGNYSTRVIVPLEVRGNGVYAWNLEKDGEPATGLRFLLLSSVGTFEVIDQQFDPTTFRT